MLAHYNLLIDNGVLGVLSKTSSEKEVVNAIRHAVKKRSSSFSSTCKTVKDSRKCI